MAFMTRRPAASIMRAAYNVWLSNRPLYPTRGRESAPGHRPPHTEGMSSPSLPPAALAGDITQLSGLADLTDLTELVAHGGVMVLSGAGLSTESGIPDYRGPDG